MDGINYYGFERVNIDLGSGSDVFNVQGTSAGSCGFALDGVHAATNVTPRRRQRPGVRLLERRPRPDGLHAGRRRFEFLTGDLDDVPGNLNLDLGAGRHRLLISDEAATVGDTNVRDHRRDRHATGAGFERRRARPRSRSGPRVRRHHLRSPRRGGNLFDGVVYWTGSGDDTITIDGTHDPAPASATTTLLNTGLGNDNVTVDLTAGEDGFFVLHTIGRLGPRPVDPLAIADQARRRHGGRRRLDAAAR